MPVYGPREAVALVIPPPTPAEGRSPHWPALEHQHLQQFPECQVCGTREHCEVHHVKPFHLFPELELSPDNLLTLCRVHHFWHGHYGDWAAWAPHVVVKAASLRAEIRHRPYTREG